MVVLMARSFRMDDHSVLRDEYNNAIGFNWIKRERKEWVMITITSQDCHDDFYPNYDRVNHGRVEIRSV